MLQQVHIYIKGDVIGVGFRAWTKIQAKIFGITGWVKNNFNQPDIFGPGGGVEAQIQGEEDKVKTFVDVVKKGPPVSHVSDVEVLWQEATEIFDDFKIIR